jgi:restriction system protein
MPIGSRFARYMNPVLNALRELGGSARPGEVYNWVAQHLGISDAERSEKHRSGASKVENDIAWARSYLVKAGYVDSSRYGVWSLTEQGRMAEALSDEHIEDIIRQVQTQAAPGLVTAEVTEEQLEKAVTQQTEEAAPEDVPRGYREQALEIMQTLPPHGFERLCQRLLRESGFQQVTVTGRAGDGGIDGIGILQINPFVSFKVLFQCKRWTSAVGSEVIDSFRGAMAGRADKGLILTTGTFTSPAQRNAVRDGVLPIELVDGQALVSLLEQRELGLVPRTTYEIDYKFFEEFKN